MLEIADANNIPRKDAGKRFFKDVEEHYDDKLGFESKIQGLQEEVNNLNQQKLKLFAELNVIPQLTACLIKLFRIEWNNSVEELNLLIDQIRKAGGIREATMKLADGSNTSEGSSTDQPANDKAAVLAVDDRDKNNSRDIEKEKEEQVSREDDDPEFKRLTNEMIDRWKD